MVYDRSQVIARSIDSSVVFLLDGRSEIGKRCDGFASTRENSGESPFVLPSNSMIWSPGHVLTGDRYTIESVVDHGRLSVTYLARKKNGDRHSTLRERHLISAID
jgi:hypothetical protein